MIEKLVVWLCVGGICLGFIAVMALVMAIPTLLLWNWLMPPIFSLPTISFWQALGINILAGLLFKNYSATTK